MSSDAEGSGGRADDRPRVLRSEIERALRASADRIRHLSAHLGDVTAGTHHPDRFAAAAQHAREAADRMDERAKRSSQRADEARRAASAAAGEAARLARLSEAEVHATSAEAQRSAAQAMRSAAAADEAISRRSPD